MNLSVDRNAPEIMDALASARIFKKYGTVQARPALAGEVITTVLADGTTETKNTANEDDWIVTNPGGEFYIIPEAKFLARYEPTEEEGIYDAKGLIRAIPNPYGQSVEIMASWGELQVGASDCWFADVCDDEGTPNGSPYLIAAEAFAQTYKPHEL